HRRKLLDRRGIGDQRLDVAALRRVRIRLECRWLQPDVFRGLEIADQDLHRLGGFKFDRRGEAGLEKIMGESDAGKTIQFWRHRAKESDAAPSASNSRSGTSAPSASPAP